VSWALVIPVTLVDLVFPITLIALVTLDVWAQLEIERTNEKQIMI
jgi:hypothetical protein